MAKRSPHKGPELDPKTPVLENIQNDVIHLDLDHWFKKAYSLDFGMAHTELPAVLEEINDCIQRAAIHMHRAKKSAEQLEGIKLMQLRQDWSTTYSDKMTESTVAAVLAQDKEILAEWDRYAVLKSWVNRLENTLENLRLKAGMMRSTEATRRKTLDDEP
jgi:hypothetical protein